MTLTKNVMRMQFGRRLCLLLGVVLAAGCRSESQQQSGSESIRILVAVSTREAVEAIAKEFSAATGVAVEVSPGSSAGLAKQIEQGTPADLFLSADQASVDYLASRGLVEQRRVLVHNQLVVVVPSDVEIPIEKLNDLADARIRRLALAEEKVPAGDYSREALKRVGVWNQVKDRVVGGSDVRVTLQLVEKGADAGMVYLTDTVGNTKVRVALEVDPSLHRAIDYPLVLLKRDSLKPAAKRFFEHLASPEASAVFEKARFRLAR